MSAALQRLSERQHDLLGKWFPDAVVERDHSWGLTETTVIQLRCHDDRYIVKAAPVGDRHLSRELQAHELWLKPWASRGRAVRLVQADAEASILATEFVPGHLVLDSPVADDPGAYRQAGELLALFHQQTSVLDPEYESKANASMLSWLDGPNRIEPAAARELRRMLDSWPTPPAQLVPTHGDWQPRNWLWNDGALIPIDFGRVALRPAMTDFARLHVQDFRRNAVLEAAFLSGYGSDPRDSKAWLRIRAREAVGTAAWAYVHKDPEFEAQGHSMIAEVLASRNG